MTKKQEFENIFEEDPYYIWRWILEKDKQQKQEFIKLIDKEQKKWDERAGEYKGFYNVTNALSNLKKTIYEK